MVTKIVQHEHMHYIGVDKNGLHRQDQTVPHVMKNTAPLVYIIFLLLTTLEDDDEEAIFEP